MSASQHHPPTTTSPTRQRPPPPQPRPQPPHPQTGRATNDLLFNSPSGAACFVGGASLNGKGAWKDRQGRNLNQIEEAEVRKAVQERRLTGSSGLRVGLGECGWAGAGGVGVGRWMVGGWLGSGRVDAPGGGARSAISPP
ncbi:DUF4357 domain-containing protein [Actinomyces procaprae]|uniref:DUF4357 domain-containing protein n=1 Tax=Actinomyces procaprae TaxID=2560010 RepID=UPI001959D61A